MKSITFDNGDPSVGIFSTQYAIECPFNKEDVTEDDLYFFKSTIGSLYNEFNSYTNALYDFEIENIYHL